MSAVRLFISACIIPGLGGAVGSIVGHAFGGRGLWIGGVVGGLVASALLGWSAARVRWIAPDRRIPTAIGTSIGFVAAAAVAVNTLSSPVGPVLSTLLAGIGAVIGSRWPSRPA